MAYTPEDLYNLYRGAGNGNGQGQAIAAEAADPYAQTEQPGSPVQDYSGLSDAYTAYTGQAPMDGASYAAETPKLENELEHRVDTSVPQEAPMGSQGMSAKEGSGWGQSASMGGRGYNEGQYGKVSKQDGERNAAMNNAQAGVQAQYAPVGQKFETAGDSAKAAAIAKTEADLEKVREDQLLANRMKGVMEGIKQEETVAAASETARLNKTITQYQSSLADFASSKVNPNDMWDGMSGGMRFGTMVTAFVHDFLGAKGIKTSAMETLKQGIDRNINAQMANINKKGEVTKGFKALYDLQAQQSKSQEEVRTRLRGFYLEAVKQETLATMSNYKSLMATAEGKKAMADVDKEIAHNFMNFTKQVTQDSNTRMAQDQQWIMHKGNLAVQQAQVAVSARANKLAEEKWKDELAQRVEKTKSAQLANALVDPSDNIAKRVIVRGSDKEQQNVRELMISANDTNETLKKLRELVLKNRGGPLDEVGITRFSDEERKLADALIDRLAHSEVKANGERATDADVQQYKKLYPLDKLGATSIKAMYDHAQDHTLKNANTYIRQYTKDLPEDQWIRGGDQTYFKEDSIKANAETKEFMRGGKQEQAVDKAQQFLGSPSNSLDNGDLTKLGIDKSDIKLDHAALTGWNPEPEAWTAGVYILGKAAAGGDKAAQDTLNKIAQTSFADAQRDPALKGFNYTDFNNLRTYAIMKTKSLDPNRNPGRFKSAQDQEDGTAPFPVMTPDQVYEQNKIQ